MEVTGIKKAIGKKIKFIRGLLILLSIIVLMYLLNGYTGFNNVKMVGLEKNIKKENTNPLRGNKVVLTSIHMGAGHNDSLGIVLASPYTNVGQESQLYEYSMKIKNDFLVSVSEEQLKRWIQNRDFDEVKTTFKKIVNQYLDEPVREVYISSFFYE